MIVIVQLIQPRNDTLKKKRFLDKNWKLKSTVDGGTMKVILNLFISRLQL